MLHLLRKGPDPWQRITHCLKKNIVHMTYNPPKEGAGAAAMSGVQKGKGRQVDNLENIDFYIDFWLAFQTQQENQYRKITPKSLKSILYLYILKKPWNQKCLPHIDCNQYRMLRETVHLQDSPFDPSRGPLRLFMSNCVSRPCV